MRAARSWGARPMEFLTEWSPRDRGLATALMVLEDTVHSCGHDLERSTHPDMDGWYGAEPVVCYACAAAERDQEENPDREPGEMRQIVELPDAPKELKPVRRPAGSRL